MQKFSIQVDPLTGEKYVEVPFKGHLLVESPLFNKGSAFTEMERDQLDLYGILPPHVSPMEVQLERAYGNYEKKPNAVEKYIFLLSLLDRNETLFYRLVLEHLEEMLPIVYTPTVGEGAKTFSHLFRRPRGLYVAANRIHLIDRILSNAPFSNITLIVVTDGERILGLGDQGVGGMAIPIGKVSLYVVGAGLPPALCLPVLLDVGTNNQELLRDPLYMGLKHNRLTDEAYDNVVEEFAKGVRRHFPHALLQWEDFGKHNALRLLNNYRERICSFDDDIQGTGAIALTTIYSAMAAKQEKLKDQRFAIFGFGQAGYGIAMTLVAALCEEGLSSDEARRLIFPVDKDGLILENIAINEYQKPFAVARDIVSTWTLKDRNKISLSDTVTNARITVLIGVSGVGGA
jgi:malate dehydrogenase (oxaloacetate-decarboxylating)